MKKEIINPFNLKKAKAGAKLRTRDGRSVEIFKWDARGECPIKGMIKEEKQDLTACWNAAGFWRSNGILHSYDLVIVEEVEEPKFKVGDWTTNGEYTYKIVEVTDNCYKCNSSEGATYLNSMNYVDKHYHLWTIQDAKAGDVLISKNKSIFIFKKIIGYTVYDYCGLYLEKFLANSSIVDNSTTDYVPATKYQCSLLFQKMKEAGYEWNTDKLELKKISNKTEEQQAVPDTIKIAKTDNGAVVITGLNNLQYDVINDLIMSWNNINYPANKND
jgi:hypothetical protein